MKRLLLFVAVTTWAQTFDVSPLQPKQGETVKITSDTAKSVRSNGKTIALFPQAGGPALGLLPISVLRKPGRYAVEFLDRNNAVLHTTEITVLDAHYKKQDIVIAPSISALKPSPDEQKTVSAFRDTVSPERFWTEPFAKPVPGCLTSPFGVMRLHNGKPTGDYHAGVDERGAAGTPIHPITPGVVKIVQKWNLRGGTVAVDHGQGVQSIYLHMSDFHATEGQHVTPADVIGYVGSTGRSTGPHVHWTLYVQGEAVNPGQWMELEPCPAPAPQKTTRKKTVHAKQK